MPKLSKIRLTGCKYDGLRKEHENPIFDLTRGEHPDHSLFTLKNGGGKGVMMQLIFQLLLPETKWGKNNGNQVVSMFYDKKERLHPFTFHVVLEWVLDTIPEKRLITGIAMKSSIKNTGEEEEEKTGLSYILYTYEHDNNGYYTIENLPLYNKEKREAIDLKELEEFLYDNRRDFIKYSQSSGRRKDSDYYRYLQSRGIYRNEWLTLKSINKSEGGISDYFSSASDNKAIFHKIIIPAISENIRNYSGDDENNLIEMFKSNLSITKDLPILLKRESDYKELLISIEPLINNADSGTRFIERKDRLIAEGNDIYYIINDETALINAEIEKWSLSYEKAMEEKKNLEFKNDNLNYNKIRDDYLLKEQKLLEYHENLDKKSRLLKEKNEELILYKINKILYKKKELEKKIENKALEKSIMIKNLNLEDIKEKAEELDYKLEIELNKRKASWLKDEVDFIGYLNYTKDLTDEEKNKRNKYRLRKDKLQNEINYFELEKENLKKQKGKLEENYDTMSLSFPEKLLEDLNDSKAKLEKDRETKLKEEEILEEKISNIRKEINKIDYILEQEKTETNELREKIEVQEKEELELARKVSRLLFKDYGISTLDSNWFEKSIEDIESLYSQKLKNLEKIQNTIWEKNIQISLNIEKYFIPNRDILLLKEAIENLGIHVETGTEYLQNISKKDMEKVLDENPGFLYSLVISNEREWELISKNLNKDFFLNNMVPIYIRSEMRKNLDDKFKTILGKAKELSEMNNYLLWKESLEEDFNNLSKTKENIRKDLESISKVKEELIGFINKGIVFDLDKRLKEREAEILKLQEMQNKLNEKLGSLTNEAQIEKANLNKIITSIMKLEKDIELMEDYIKELKKIEEKQIQINGVVEELQNVDKSISHMEENIEDIRYKQDSLRENHRQWKFHIESLIKRVNVFVREVQFKPELDKSYRTFNMPNFNLDSNILNLILEERENIEKDITSRDSQLAVLDNDIKYLNKDLQTYTDELNILSKNWNQYEDLNLPLIEIDIIINELTKNIDRITEERTTVKSGLDSLKGELKVMRDNLNLIEEQIIKNHKRAALILNIKNIDLEINNVQIGLRSNSEILSLCISELEKNRTRINRLEVNLNKIAYRPELDLTKGKKNNALMEKIQKNIDLVLDEWQQKLWNNEIEIKKTIDEGERYRTRFTKDIELKLGEDKLKNKIVSVIKEVNINNFRNNRESLKSMKEHFSLELMRLTKDKEKAEEAMKQWTQRASIYVIRMIETLKDMITSMNYINDNGYVFPLVKLKNIERLPKEEEEIAYLLEEHFIESISKVLKQNENIEKLDHKFIESLVGDNMIFSKALQGRYPVLLVYKMTENNEFKYARPKDEHYATWEAINKGEGISTEGSGGQTLSVTTFVTMMIMSFKKKHIGNENPSTILLLDNPFGKASGKHVLDPIFEIADKLNFQLICFAAPEIIKVEISERFPIFWELRIEEGKVIHGGRIIKEQYIQE